MTGDSKEPQGPNDEEEESSNVSTVHTVADELPNLIIESSKVSVSSINELKNGFKRPLSDEMVSSTNEKKIKLFEIDDCSDEETEFTLITKNSLEKNDNVSILIEKLKTFTDKSVPEHRVNQTFSDTSVPEHQVNQLNESSQINTENDHSDDVSNESPNQSSENDNRDNPIETPQESIEKDNSNDSHDDVNNIRTSDQKINSPSKKPNSEEVITNNENNLSTTDITENSENEFDQNDHNNSPLNSSSPGRLVIVENDDDDDDEKSSQVTDKNATSVDDGSESNNIAEITNATSVDDGSESNNLVELNNIAEITNEPPKKDANSLPEPSNNRFQHIHPSLMESFRNVEKSNKVADDDCVVNEEFELIESESDSSMSANDVDLHDQKIADDIVNGLEKLSPKSYPYLIDLIFKQGIRINEFESICLQKILEYWTEKSIMGKFRNDAQLILEREKSWRKKYTLLHKQCRELKTIVKMHVNDLKLNPNAKPHIITRTVGLQATMCPNKGGYGQQKKVTAPQKVQQTITDSVDISDDDDIANISDSEDNSGDENISSVSSQPSCSKTPGNIRKKQTSGIEKAKSTSIPPDLNPISNDTIDLTDDCDVQNNVNEGKSPNKTVRQHSIMNTSVSNQMASKLPTHVLPKNITYIEIPNLPTSSPSFIMRTPSSTRHSQLGTISNLSPSNKDTNGGRLVYTNGKIVPVHQIPVINSNIAPKPVQVAQSFPSLQVGQNLKPVKTVHVGQPLKSLKNLKPNVTYTRQLSPGSQRNGILQPVPASIPILNHPAPLPVYSSQKNNVNTSKKRPPAPILTLNKGSDSCPEKALVLSWNMSLNKSHADISSYQIYSYQEMPSEAPRCELWSEIGNVNALPVPMACSLTHFSRGGRYHFAVRAVDSFDRKGPFSSPKTIDLI